MEFDFDEPDTPTRFNLTPTGTPVRSKSPAARRRKPARASPAKAGAAAPKSRKRKAEQQRADDSDGAAGGGPDAGGRAGGSGSGDDDDGVVDLTQPSTATADGAGVTPRKTPSRPLGSERALVVAKALPSHALLVECSGQPLDFSGDVGCVGRLRATRQDVLVDLKGYMYKGPLVPCNTFLAVSLSGADAKIELAASEFVPLTELDNVFDKERLLSGDAQDLDPSQTAPASQGNDSKKDKLIGQGKRLSTSKKKARRRK